MGETPQRLGDCPLSAPFGSREPSERPLPRPGRRTRGQVGSWPHTRSTGHGAVLWGNECPQPCRELEATLWRLAPRPPWRPQKQPWRPRGPKLATRGLHPGPGQELLGGASGAPGTAPRGPASAPQAPPRHVCAAEALLLFMPDVLRGVTCCLLREDLEKTEAQGAGAGQRVWARRPAGPPSLPSLCPR